MEIRVVLADICGVVVDAVVTAGNSALVGGSGVNGAVHAAAGPELLQSPDVHNKYYNAHGAAWEVAYDAGPGFVGSVVGLIPTDATRAYAEAVEEQKADWQQWYGADVDGESYRNSKEITERAALIAGGATAAVRGGLRRSVGESAEDAATAVKTSVDRSFQFPGGGRNGAKVKSFTGPPSMVARGAVPGRIYVTDENGHVILDITRDRTKPVLHEQGFERGMDRKQAPTAQELAWIDELWGVVDD